MKNKFTLVVLSLLGVFFTPLSARSEGGEILVSYSFDDQTLPLDNNSLFFFNNASGKVGYSKEFAFSGYNAIELQEGQFDEEFTELQGRFPFQTKGVLNFSFALLIENPEEELNIAVAGTEHFRVKKDGIALWLHTQNGVLIHETDGIPRKLFSFNPFKWYFFDVTYDIDSGKYDLFVREEGNSKEILSLLNQPNASNNPASGLDRFSFIGDLGDRSRVHYFIDDIILTKYPSREIARRELAKARNRSKINGAVKPTNQANTRQISSTPPSQSSRKLRRGYIDGYLEMQLLLRQQLRCLPATSPEDLGLDSDSLATLVNGIEAPTLDERITLALKETTETRILSSLQVWMRGCQELREGALSKAEASFRDALRSQPQNALFKSALLLALSSSPNLPETDELLVSVVNEWAEDSRLPALRAFLQSSRGDFARAHTALSSIAEQMREAPQTRVMGEFLASDSTDKLITELKKDYPSDWTKRLDDLFIAQNYFYNLLWNGKFPEATEYAQSIYIGLKALNIVSLSWREREGDAAYLAGDLPRAQLIYHEILKSAQKRVVWRKLLNVAHQLKDRKFEIQTRKRFAKSGTNRKS